MKKILFSLITIALALTGGILATRAYFSHTEQVLGNSISTGRVSISIGQIAQGHFSLNDLKPGYVRYIDLTITNDGSNPVNAIKRLKITNDPGALSAVIKYDENVELYNNANQLIWHQMLYNLDTTLGGINNQDQFLGMIPVGYHMKVRQSYHMDENAGNNYQNQTITFDMSITGEQLKGDLTLLPKSGDPNWQWVLGGAKGTLTYGVMDATFKGTFTTTGLAAGNYSLIVYKDPWPGTGSILLGLGSPDGSGVLNITFNVDPGTLTNAKVWLVLSSDFSAGQMIDWHPSSYLFETGLIDYYKSP